MSDALECCIGELKRSCILSLGPQTSIRQVVDTCIGNSAVMSSVGGQLKHSKCLSGLVMNSGDNEYLLFIHELCETFFTRNRTGVSTLISYICFLLDQLRDLRANPQLLEGVLDLMLDSFEKSVQSLRLTGGDNGSGEEGCNVIGSVHLSSHGDCAAQRLEEKLQTVVAVPDMMADTVDDDDIGWFFSDDITSITTVPVPAAAATAAAGYMDAPAHHSHKHTPTPMPTPTTTTQRLSGHIGTFENLDVNIWKGLEHCLRWDFDFSYHENSNVKQGVFLPMHIALSAASHVLAHDLSNTMNIKTNIIELHSPLIKSMSFEWIQGNSIRDTAVYEDTVIEFCESVTVKKDKPRQGKGKGQGKGGGVLESPHVAAQGARVYASYQQALEMQTATATATARPKSCRPVAGLQQVAVVDLAVPTEDKSTAQLRVSGSGGSQQADTLQQHVSHVHHSDTSQEVFEIIQHMNRKDSYIEQALAHLLALNVQVLLCPYSVPLKLLDACYENGICVVPMSTDNLHIMAKLTQADVMEDILDLYSECLGCRWVARSGHSDFVQITARDCVRRVPSDEPDSIYNSQLSVMLLLSVHSREETFGDGDGGDDGGGGDDMEGGKRYPTFASSGTPHMPYANSSLGRHRHASVLITCPTAVMGSITEDRIRKCVSRIDMVIRRKPALPLPPVDNTARLFASSHGHSLDLLRQVVPGGGVVELMCAMHIQEFRNEHTSTKDTTMSPAVLYADRLIQSLQDFVYTVNTNNGQTPGYALSMWHACVQEVKSKHKAWEQATTADCESAASILEEFMSSLDTTQLLHIPRPIVVDEDEDSVILDVASLKVETMRVACFAVKAILGTSFIVTLK